MWYKLGKIQYFVICKVNISLSNLNVLNDKNINKRENKKCVYELEWDSELILRITW